MCQNLTLKECLKIDLRIVYRLTESNDFLEGIRCFFINKNEKPKWTYSDPLAIPNSEID